MKLNKITLFILVLFTACQNKETDLIKDDVSLEFYYGTNSIHNNSDSIWYVSNLGQSYNIMNLFYLISDIRLTNSDGNTSVNLADIHFISSYDNNSQQLLIPEILSIGQYTNIEFVFGLNTERNISNNYINDYFHSQMVWPDFMGGGYHYMKLEGRFGNDSNFYNTHTGGLNGVDYSFNQSFPINLISRENGNTHYIEIYMDINHWYNNPNDILISSEGIMGDSTIQQKLRENGQKNVFEVNLSRDI